MPAQHWQFQTIHYPDAKAGTSITSINDSGGVAGFYSATFSTTPQGFSDISGAFTRIVEGRGTFATGINDQGQIVGYGAGPGRFAAGFLDDHGTFTTISRPGSCRTEVDGINDRGQVIGISYQDGSGAQAFAESGGHYTNLVGLPPGAMPSDINNNDRIVGSYFTGSLSHGFVGKNGHFSMLDAPGAVSTRALGNNDAGLDGVAGYSSAFGVERVRRPNPIEGCFRLSLHLSDTLCIRSVKHADHADPVVRQKASFPGHAVDFLAGSLPGSHLGQIGI